LYDLPSNPYIIRRNISLMHGIIFLFNICDYSSFTFVANWIEELICFEKLSNINLRKILVGHRYEHEGQEIDLKEVNSFVTNNGISFIETTTGNDNIIFAFKCIIQSLKYNNKKSK